jgi:hypothetical protein
MFEEEPDPQSGSSHVLRARESIRLPGPVVASVAASEVIGNRVEHVRCGHCGARSDAKCGGLRDHAARTASHRLRSIQAAARLRLLAWRIAHYSRSVFRTPALHAAPHPKRVLAYIDIGRAESHRRYWNASTTGTDRCGRGDARRWSTIVRHWRRVLLSASPTSCAHWQP